VTEGKRVGLISDRKQKNYEGKEVNLKQEDLRETSRGWGMKGSEEETSM